MTQFPILRGNQEKIKKKAEVICEGIIAGISRKARVASLDR
jgi:hypothetical protein